MYANFVTSLDGVVSLGEDVPPSVISGKSGADRFVMGLLRACAGAVVIGSGTLRAEPRHEWTPQHIFPPLAGAYRELRTSLGLPELPLLVVLTRSGDLPTSVPAFELGALVFTTIRGAAKLRGKLPKATTVRTSMSDRLDPTEVTKVLLGDGHRTILTEGGPRVFGSFLRSAVVRELFLTLSPRIAGRSKAARRPGLVEDMALGPQDLLAMPLLSAKRHESHLFLRYGVG